MSQCWQIKADGVNYEFLSQFTEQSGQRIERGRSEGEAGPDRNKILSRRRITVPAKADLRRLSGLNFDLR
jgi:hypothetical protein